VLRKAKIGVRLRRFREERGLTQAALAQALGISPSYVNQMESNQRPVTAPVLLKLADVFEVDLQQFSTDEADRLAIQLRDVIADPSIGEHVPQAEIRELAEAMPAVARYLIEVHRLYQHTLEANQTIASRIDAGSNGSSAVPSLMAYEEVRDLFYDERNYFPVLDEMAEQIFEASGLVVGDTAPGIAGLLSNRYATQIVELEGGEASDVQRRYDPETRVLAVSPLLDPGRRAFQLATHLAFVEAGEQINHIATGAALSSDETRALATIGLANYFAGALVLPYRRFLEAAEALRYDINLLQRRFGVGYETVAHRLSTLQRPGAKGIPFFFVRVDRAGNISKRQSATDFHFSRFGGTCPLWNVYEAFAHPGQIRTQLAQMPDGRKYLWVARTVARTNGGYGTPPKTFAVGLGCDLQHAPRLVYADGLDLTNPAALVPIGPGCKVCERQTCPQRAFPAIGKPLEIDTYRSRFIPYGVAHEPTRQRIAKQSPRR
jgi:predicted transcriptional regulator/transcriptional regulator with XRE-family HTH domain